jgi:hypothetical protein
MAVLLLAVPTPASLGPFHSLSAGTLTAALFLLTLVALEAGFRVSRLWQRPIEVAALQASVLGLTGLLLGFSFSLSEMRYDERRHLAVKEANAVGTLYLRAGYLPPNLRDAMRSSLRRYLDVHIEAAESRGAPNLLRPLLAENAQLQQSLWHLLQDHVAELHPTVLLLLTNSMNEVIDTSGERWAASRTRLPWMVVLLLMVVVLASAVILAFQPKQERRNFFQWTVFCVVMLSAMYTLLDLDRPAAGIIRTSVQPLIDQRDAFEP